MDGAIVSHCVRTVRMYSTVQYSVLFISVKVDYVTFDRQLTQTSIKRKKKNTVREMVIFTSTRIFSYRVYNK